ncbi:MAG TPA: hypothetical protein VIJ51_13165 [Solirubrobacteraceae bacterium]
MRVRGLACAVAGGVALGLPGLALGDTMIGQYDQNGDQGVNSTQAGVQTAGGPGYSAPGIKFVDGSSKGSESQNSTNIGVGVEAISPAATGTVVGDAAQNNAQGINSAQGAKKGHQNSTNLAVSAEIIAPQDGDAIIGTTNQADDQGVNSSQLLSSTKGGGVLFTGRTGGSSNQNSLNAVISAQVILGG